ncbi:kinase-like protein [Gigaspora margarita]|uniref:Kinase-like protein n=1 Tax=Gigaspora margarita TaxID=4874 RepID=A0A8H4ABZ6_GIGMA|nr:kinase-like protein [Gigaspora margarita]
MQRTSYPIIIGIGGFGRVLKYEWRDSELMVALKCLKVYTSIDEKIIKNFINELKLLRRVSNHTNVISFYGVTKDSNGYYHMILQYASDRTLREYLMANFTKLQWTDKQCIAKEIALGLLFLHDNNIIHRDLHSKNILIHQRNQILQISDYQSKLMKLLRIQTLMECRHISNLDVLLNVDINAIKDLIFIALDKSFGKFQAEDLLSHLLNLEI